MWAVSEEVPECRTESDYSKLIKEEEGMSEKKKEKKGGVPRVVINAHLQGLKRNKVHKGAHVPSYHENNAS